MCDHEIRADGACDCGLWYDPSVLDHALPADPSVLDRALPELSPAELTRPVSTEEGETAGQDLSGESQPLDGGGTLSASRAESHRPPITPSPDPLEPIGANARASISRPLRYCPTCRDTHAEDAPHFLNRTREVGM